MWEHNGLLVTIFGRGCIPPEPPIPLCTVVSEKRFLHDLQHGMLGEVAFLGLIQPSVTTGGVISIATAMWSVLSADMARSVSD